MIKTIIADDEKWICKLISNLVDWEALGFSVISKAYDGESLLQQIDLLQPNLVITDIRMPGLSGIDVIRKCYERNCPTKFVIISGYGDFSYAKTAIKYGVLGYLLKPVEKSELKDLLETIKKDISSHCLDNENGNLLRKQLKQSQLRCLEYFFNNRLAYANIPMPSVDELNTEFNCHFSEGIFRIFFLKFDPHTKDICNNAEDITHQAASLCYKIFQSACYGLCTVCSPFSISVITNYSPDQDRLIQGLASDLLYTCTYSIPHMTKYDITIGVGSMTNSLSGLYDSLCDAKNAARARIQYGSNKLIDLSGHSFSTPTHLIDEYTQREIHDFVRGQGEVTCDALSKKILDGYVSETDAAPYLPYSAAYAAIKLLLTVMPPKVRSSWTLEHPEDSITIDIENCATIDALTALISNVLSDIKKLICADGHTGHNAIEMIKTYIDQNYNKEIKLDDLADYVYLNANYVSELFKKETGINFSKYLVSKRMEMAKIFLLDTRYKINDVASMVGYSDAKHFSRLFKSHIGVTPAQYKKMFS